MTCPKCRRSAHIVWVLGRPLGRTPKPGDTGKGYVRPHELNGWVVERGETDQVVLCPDCGTEVKRRALTPN